MNKEQRNKEQMNKEQMNNKNVLARRNDEAIRALKFQFTHIPGTGCFVPRSDGPHCSSIPKHYLN